MDRTSPLLRLRNIRRSFPGATPTIALKRIDLDVFEGTFLAIEGPSGGGKSTLLNVIGLLDSPSEGSYEIASVEAHTLSELERANLRLAHFAFIFQSFHLLDRRPVVDSVELGLLYRGLSAGSRRARALDALREVGLSHRAHHVAATLSGGERQRVAIARALASRAPIVIADEPTGNLDSDNSRQVMTSLQRLHESGTTIILVTHSPEVAAAATHRVTIRDGEIVDATGADASTSAGEEVPSSASRVFASDRPRRPPLKRLQDLIGDAVASAWSRPGRTVGLASAVGVGVALFVGTLGIAASATTQVSSAFDAHANRDVTVSWTTATTADASAEERGTLVRRIDTLSGVDAAGLLTSLGQTHTQASSTRPVFDVDGFAITAQIPKAARLSIRWTSPVHHMVGSGEVLVGDALAKKIELGPLDGSPIILVNNNPMTVVGVIKSSPRLPELVGGVSVAEGAPAGFLATQTKAVILTRPGAAQQVAKQAPLVIYPYDTSKLTIDAPADPASLRVRIQQELQSTLFALTGIASFAAIAGLANSMTASVLARKHEFGLRRAVGATAQQVRNLVLAEATLIGAFGGIIGLTVGLGGILCITVIQRWSPIFDFLLAPLALIGGILVGITSGALAARKAAKIQPHQALRS